MGGMSGDKLLVCINNYDGLILSSLPVPISKVRRRSLSASLTMQEAEKYAGIGCSRRLNVLRFLIGLP